MKIFISWSGDESRQVAEALRDWLPMVFESVEPYMSARDNEAGTRWAGIVAAQLDESDFGILCCTRSNLAASWLLFEAGALGKAVDFARVVPLLHNLAPSDLTSPLSQFMAKRDDRAGVLDVVRAINGGLARPRPPAALDGLFDAVWPGLADKLTAVTQSDPHPSPPRPERELLEEILQVVRDQRSAATVARGVSLTGSGSLSRPGEIVRQPPTGMVPTSALRQMAARLHDGFGSEISLSRGAQSGTVILVVPTGTPSHMREDLADAALKLLKRWDVHTVELAEAVDRFMATDQVDDTTARS